MAVPAALDLRGGADSGPPLGDGPRGEVPPRGAGGDLPRPDEVEVASSHSGPVASWTAPSGGDGARPQDPADLSRPLAVPAVTPAEPFSAGRVPLGPLLVNAWLADGGELPVLLRERADLARLLEAVLHSAFPAP